MDVDGDIDSISADQVVFRLVKNGRSPQEFSEVTSSGLNRFLDVSGRL